MPGQEERVARMGAELARSRVTLEQVQRDFDAIARRAEPGIYPGLGPRKSYELEIAALTEDPPLSVSWMAISGQNLSIRRADFEALGGFVEELSLNEHRELALRACERGGHVTFVPATTFHMTHRVGVRDPMDDLAWEKTFYRLHPTPATKLMRIFWASLAEHPAVPAAARIPSLAALEAIVRHGSSHDYEAIHRELWAAAERSAAQRGTAGPAA